MAFQVRADECTGSDCINSTNFSINVSTFTPGSTALANGGGSASTVNGVLGKIIDSLIVAFGVLSLLFMTLGAGYMIIHHGDDSLLSRGKSIFVAGLISLAIALSAGMIVKLTAYFLYQ